MRARVVIAGCLTAASLSAWGAGAQTAPEAAREACRSSAISLCPSEAMSGDRARVRACLVRNIAKAAPQCQAAVNAARARAAETHIRAAPLKP